MEQLALAFALLSQMASPSKPFSVQFVAEQSGRTVQVCLNGTKVETCFAGKLGFRDGKNSWTSVCGAVHSPVRLGQAFPVVACRTTVVGGGVKIAGNIAAKYFKAAVTPDQCAGLQLAVWEAIEDAGSRPDFHSGRFQANASPAVLGYAAQYYQAATTPGTAIFLQTGNSGQSQVTVT